jgi:hypothetical protein
VETWEWIVVAAVAAAAVLIVAGLVGIRRRRSHLKSRFGTEYDRVVKTEGVGQGEKDLRDIEREHDDLSLRTLPQATRERYLDEWRAAEARFVTDPADAARAADRIVQRALEECGYATDGDDERRTALVAVDHPDAAERYRHGHARLEGDPNTEELRKAMIDLRAVLEDVVHSRPTTAA